MYEFIKPSFGSQIRVNRGLYYHHGIFVDDSHVIHFAAINCSNEMDPKNARIVMTDLQSFLKNGVLETKVYTKEELKQVRSPQDIVNYAFSRLGDGGYDLIKNNCEHFSNECAFGVPKSEQVSSVLSNLANLFGGC